MTKVNSILLPGVNDTHMAAVARKMGEMGVDIFNCMPYFPTEGSNFEHLKEPPKKMVKKIRNAAQTFVPQMTHCKRCRADAVGLLDDPLNEHFMERLTFHANTPIPFPTVSRPFAAQKETPGNTEPEKKTKRSDPPRPYVAVATREGVLVNQHLGEASTLNVYDLNRDTPVLVEKRRLPTPGSRNFRWYGLAETIKDCHTILVSGIGKNPKQILVKEGFHILEVNGMIDMVLSAIKNKEDISHLVVRAPTNCGECRGTGTGCM